MSVFGIFISPQEYKFKQLMKAKPTFLMYTSKRSLKANSPLPLIKSDELNKEVAITTSSEKIALLHVLDPLFSFKFGVDEYGALILGESHNLLKLDKESAYIYSIDSDKFYPIVDKKGEFEGKWYSEEMVSFRDDLDVRKVKFNDVLGNGIQVFWIDSLKTLKQIDEEMNNQNITTGEKKLEYLINQTNWKSDKVVYMNKYKNIAPVKIEENSCIIEYNKSGKGKQKD